MNKSIKLLVVALACLGTTTTILAAGPSRMTVVDTKSNQAAFAITVTYQTCYNDVRGPVKCYNPKTVLLTNDEHSVNVSVDYNAGYDRNELFIKEIRVNNTTVENPKQIFIDHGELTALFISPYKTAGGGIAIGSQLQRQ